MILLDTSLLSLAFGRTTRSGGEPAAVDELRRLIAKDSPIAIPGVVLQELLAEVNDDAAFRRLQRLLETFPILTASQANHVEAARLANTCRRAGVRVSPTVCLIAALSIDTDSPLFTLDRDFSRMAPLCGLRLFEPGMMRRKPRRS